MKVKVEVKVVLETFSYYANVPNTQNSTIVPDVEVYALSVKSLVNGI